MTPLIADRGPESDRTNTTPPGGIANDPFSALRLFGSVQRGPTNLPAQTTTLIDREQELESLRALIDRNGARLITLTGPGGTGKTRLALECASTLTGRFIDGIFIVWLAPIKYAGLVPSTIASTLGVMEKGGQPVEQTLKDFLRGKQVLLILDNFEQVISAANLVSELLSECPRLKMLVTSRAPLRVRGERELGVLPLALPDISRVSTASGLLEYAAVKMFVERAQSISPNFDLTPENFRAVAEICNRLDGLPLALELAAARIRVLSPQHMLLRLRKRLDLLTGGTVDLPARQQTLRNTIAWSYDLLDDECKKLFLRLSVFPGSFSLLAAERICTLPNGRESNTLDLLSRLLERSLVQNQLVGGELRFVMLETIREFAFDSLATTAELSYLQRSFVEYYLSLLEDASANLRGAEQAALLSQLDHEHHNLQVAIRLSIDNRQPSLSLRLGSAMWMFWYIRGHLTEGRFWLEKVLENSESMRTVPRARSLLGAGALAALQNDFNVARSALNEAIALSKDLGDEEGVALALIYLGNIVADQGDPAKGRQLHEESLALFRRLGNNWGAAIVLNTLGVTARILGDYDRATKLHQQSLELFRTQGDKRYTAIVLIDLGFVLERRGQYERAREIVNQALSFFVELGDRVGMAASFLLLGSISRSERNLDASQALLAKSLFISHEMGYKEMIVLCLEEIAGSRCLRGDAQRATRLLASAQVLRQNIGIPVPSVYKIDIDRTVALARSTLGERRFQQEWAKGLSITVEQAITYATSPQDDSKVD